MSLLREISLNGGPARVVQLTRGARKSSLDIDGKRFNANINELASDGELSVDGSSTYVSRVVDRDTVLIHAFGRTWRVSVVDPAERALQSANQTDVAKSPMPGVVVSVSVEAGDNVTAGQPLMIIESMKMQTEIQASRDGCIEQVVVQVGETFPLNATLVKLVPLAAQEN
jgi:biotin carboxyl carrier protein